MIDIILWTILIILILCGGWVIEEDGNWFWNMLITLAYGLGLCWMNSIKPWAWIMEHKLGVIEGVLCYLGVGVLWAILKFTRRASKLKSSDLLEGYSPRKELKIKESFNKLFARVPVWIAFWPWVILWDILSDYLKSFFEWLADILKGIFVSLFNLVTKDAQVEAIQISKARKEEIEKENPFND